MNQLTSHSRMQGLWKIFWYPLWFIVWFISVSMLYTFQLVLDSENLKKSRMPSKEVWFRPLFVIAKIHMLSHQESMYSNLQDRPARWGCGHWRAACQTDQSWAHQFRRSVKGCQSVPYLKNVKYLFIIGFLHWWMAETWIMSYTVHQLFYQSCSHCSWKENASNQQFVRAGSWRRIWWIPVFAIPWAIPISGQARAATCQTESFAVSDNSSLELGSASFCLVICLLK